MSAGYHLVLWRSPQAYCPHWQYLNSEGEQIREACLNHEDQWEGEVSFTPTRVGTNQKIDFWLYRDGEEQVYRIVHLWVDVKEKSGIP